MGNMHAQPTTKQAQHNGLKRGLGRTHLAHARTFGDLRQASYLGEFLQKEIAVLLSRAGATASLESAKRLTRL